ncbi:MAG: leucine-rich repeat domain-containing protein [Lachnospiraceae bacterium]|nr:leucine-rich repeat domain-containing protein [Lachnospiraceae bacterium]
MRSTSRKTVKILLMLCITFIALFLTAPAKASAETVNRPIGNEFVSYLYDLKCRVLTSGTGSSLGTVEIFGVDGAETHITIPDTVLVFNDDYSSEEFTVVSIAPSAFKNNTNIRSFTISSTSHVSVIPKNCLANCKNLTTVSLYNIKTIETGAFNKCISLKNLGVYDDALKTIGKNAFKQCKKLDYFTIWDSKLKSVGKNAFKGTKNRLTIYSRSKKNYNLVKKSGGTNNLRFIKITGNF